MGVIVDQVSFCPLEYYIYPYFAIVDVLVSFFVTYYIIFALWLQFII